MQNVPNAMVHYLPTATHVYLTLIGIKTVYVYAIITGSVNGVISLTGLVILSVCRNMDVLVLT